ncbi:hypothetical protein SCP_0503990 [Sparassis crispa]|uniref:Uncharacterized protein n=1 Tax=Sparassis crispa TaxID=139825 RepID=A0A401GM90_9APHY|nr:hypothetical protein SCP_0503990 [Sparassis crispa]GBE83351.1 hypothetical protein SCP_0503990 [Sparassis crispa]
MRFSFILSVLALSAVGASAFPTPLHHLAFASSLAEDVPPRVPDKQPTPPSAPVQRSHTWSRRTRAHP